MRTLMAVAMERTMASGHEGSGHKVPYGSGHKDSGHKEAYGHGHKVPHDSGWLWP